jgi:hypothetical protein
VLNLQVVHCLDVPTSGTLGTQHKQTASLSVRSTRARLPAVRTCPYVVSALRGTGEGVRDSTAACPKLVVADPTTADEGATVVACPAFSVAHGSVKSIVPLRNPQLANRVFAVTDKPLLDPTMPLARPRKSPVWAPGMAGEKK